MIGTVEDNVVLSEYFDGLFRRESYLIIMIFDLGIYPARKDQPVGLTILTG